MQPSFDSTGYNNSKPHPENEVKTQDERIQPSHLAASGCSEMVSCTKHPEECKARDQQATVLSRHAGTSKGNSLPLGTVITVPGILHAIRELSLTALLRPSQHAITHSQSQHPSIFHPLTPKLTPPPNKAHRKPQAIMGDYTPQEPALAALIPIFTPSSDAEPPRSAALIQTLGLIPHVEGGYFTQTDEDPTTIPSPYPPQPLTTSTAEPPRPGFDAAVRRLSTTIFYLLTPRRPLGRFHRNRSRIVHTLHRGRGRYVLLHPAGRVETFVVGPAVERGERLQWVVEGGVWKASYLLDDGDAGGLLISETVVPGFEYADHEFLSQRRLGGLLPEDKAAALGWLAREDEDGVRVAESSGEAVEVTEKPADDKSAGL
ncbi:hypothetical protein AK830_g9487 [Neonectria ditissima]|uniref:DUF985 domain-containing protein n=1 Tax=Neonectria ditissima TaxID=78410 RepID=A0A0P7ARU2_9HYPO|nr:hypothetical protein AK830_g9487 [Neonectria ditissima]